MHQSIIIIDDALPEPDRFRDIARQSTYPTLTDITNFPGRNSEQRYDLRDLDALIMDIVGEELKPMAGTGHGKFRLTLADDIGAARVHLDNSQWSGILYLSPDEYAQGGTDFFRHIPTGLDSALLSKATLKKQGWDTHEAANAAINKIVVEHSNDDSQWDHIMRVPMKFNRLLLLRPWLWHTAGPGFGSSFEDGRLVLLMFYQKA